MRAGFYAYTTGEYPEFRPSRLAKASFGVVSYRMNLLSFQRPSRYINNEWNSVHKRGDIRVALAFPDMYEVGMSHLGLRILYRIINGIPYASAERVFSPWTDLEEALRKEREPLRSLESATALSEFDIVGFSLQYELCYTTVLNMLDLGGIPVRSEERISKGDMPLVIAGGPCTLNPHPVSAFIDAFLVGDGEDAIREILDIFHGWKQGGDRDRRPLLSALSEIEGVYVPSITASEKNKKVLRRVIPSLDDSPFPDNPVLPYTNIVHDRVNIEIARGCSMGCRFCQAGIACRPVRERSLENILGLAARSLKNTGYEDVSFTSLSSGDYSCLNLLMKEFNREFSARRISLSLPSLRVGSINREMLREMKTVRRTGFTMAPEAGTDRLRAVINKDFTEEMYIRALEILFREGWHNLKLYFMTGLPTETEEDIEAIPEMVFKAIKISKQLTGRHVTISAGVSSFIPKPHTPFQWYGQNNIDTLREKNSYLKRAFLRRGVKYKGHNEEMSLLEAVFARGDERLAGLIEAAWKEGCRLDAWTELFDFGKWEKAMELSGIDAISYATREYGTGDDLPWDNIDTGITKAYLAREYRNAVAGRFTVDCRKACHACGLGCPEKGVDQQSAITTLSEKTEEAVKKAGMPGKSGPPAQENFIRVRVKYAKTGKARFLSHIELMTAILRAMRRAGLPLRYSSGFHPLPKISFGPALGVGIAGLSEYFDLELLSPVDIGSVLKDLRAVLPDGIYALQMAELFGREKSLNSFISRYVYEARYNGGLDAGRYSGGGALLVTRKEREIDIRPMIEDVEHFNNDENGDGYRLTVKDLGELKVRLDELMPAVFGIPAAEMDITRTAMYGQASGSTERWPERWIEPMERENIWAAKS